MNASRTPVLRHTPLAAAVLASVLLMGYTSNASAALALTHSYVSTTTDVGTGVSSILPVPSSHSYSHTFNAPTTAIPGSPGSGYGFYDDFVFQITAASANAITSTIDFANILQITNLQVRLFNASGNSFPVLGSPAGCPGPGCTLIDAWSTPVNYGPTTGTVTVLETTVLAAGTYVLQVRGNVVGSAGGSYSGVLNLAPVPVPAAAWLLGSGLVGLAGIARSRRPV
jgi:hypothetical protein